MLCHPSVVKAGHGRAGLLPPRISDFGPRYLPRAFFFLERPVFRPSGCWRLWIFHLDPGFRWAGFINRCEPLAHDSLKPEIANGGEKPVAIACSTYWMPSCALRSTVPSYVPLAAVAGCRHPREEDQKPERPLCHRPYDYAGRRNHERRRPTGGQLPRR